jgi:uncharacterized membrane protein YkoI
LKLNRKTIAATVMTLGAIGAGAYAYAADSAGNDALALSHAKITLTQAVTAAEAKVQGKAARAELEQAKGGRWTFDVEVVAAGKTYDVSVDAASGEVLSATEDRNEHDEENDKD